MIRQYLAPTGYVVSLQNCINEERIAGIVGWGRTVGAIAAILSAELYAPGKIRRTGAKNPPGHEVYRVGEVHGRMTQRIEELGAMIRTVDTCKVTDNLWGERWSKLCVNGMHNGVSAASGLSGNDMRQDARIRRVIIKLGGEAVRIGQALGYRLEDIAGQDSETLARASEGDRAALDSVESLMLALRNSQQRSEHQRPSMGQDMEKGRRTEIDFINGVIVERGREVGLPAPTHEKLIAAVSTRRAPRPNRSGSYGFAVLSPLSPLLDPPLLKRPILPSTCSRKVSSRPGAGVAPGAGSISRLSFKSLWSTPRTTPAASKLTI